MIEDSSSEVVVKFGDNFDAVFADIESSVPSLYVFSHQVQVFNQGSIDDQLILKVKEIIDAIVRKNNALIWDRETRQHETYRVGRIRNSPDES